MPQNQAHDYDGKKSLLTQGEQRDLTGLDGRFHESFDMEFAAAIEDGFAQDLKTIPSRWLYDAAGSQLFSRITRLPEYYPTSREAEILQAYASEIAKACGDGPWRVCEFGAGDGKKTEILLREWSRTAQLEFWPIDVSETALDELCRRMTTRLPQLTCRPVVADNFDGLKEVEAKASGSGGGGGGRFGSGGDRSRELRARVAVLHLGSSVGNCERPEVDKFLSRLREGLAVGDMALIGFDLIKDSGRLLRAYDDAAGVTREFNLNLLRRMNRELGANFEVDWFRHEATWNPAISGMESWLVSLHDQVITIGALGRSYHLRKWEPIRTEVSLKFDPDSLAGLAERNGFRQVRRFEDSAGDFTDALWMAASAKNLI